MPVAAYFNVASARACGMTIETVRSTGMALPTSVIARSISMTPGPGLSTTGNFFDSASLRTLLK